MVGKSYPPDSDVVACRDCCVSVLVSVTTAPATTAPLASLTLPTIEPNRVWAFPFWTARSVQTIDNPRKTRETEWLCMKTIPPFSRTAYLAALFGPGISKRIHLSDVGNKLVERVHDLFRTSHGPVPPLDDSV